MPLLLYRWADHGTVTAEHATITILWFQQVFAVPALVEVLAGIRRHLLCTLESAVRTRHDGNTKEFHDYFPCKSVTVYPVVLIAAAIAAGSVFDESYSTAAVPS